MARPKKSTTETASTSEKNNVEVNETVTENVTNETTAAEGTKETVTEKKATKTYKENDVVKIKCENLINRKVVGSSVDEVFSFNEKGICEMPYGKAKRFLTIPGYSICK